MKKKKDPYALRDIYDEMELELITSMQRNLIKHNIDEYNAGFSWEMWQKAKLRNIIDYRRETNETLYRFAKRIKFAIRDVLEYHFHKGRNFKIKIPENGKNTAKVGEDPPNEDQFFGMNEKKLNALVESTTNDFKDIQQSVYRKMDDVYRQTIFKTAYQMASGTIPLDKAIDKSVESFLKKGIDCIVYKNGRHVNIADYAEMALRTASHRATLLGEGSKRDEMGVHLVFVSAHANACKLCLPWQGQILIDDVFSHPSEDYIAKYKDKYKLLSDAIKAGLLHPNCRHTLATYFEGVTRLPKKQDPVQALKNYNNEQEQRRLEREIRKQKRIYAGVVDKADKKEASANLRQAQKNLRDFLKEHPEFKRHPHREKNHFNDVHELADDGLDIKQFKSAGNISKHNHHNQDIVNKYFNYMKIKTKDSSVINYIKRDISLMPLKDLEFLKKYKVSIESSDTNSKYRSSIGMNKIMINYTEGKAQGSFAHEFAHCVSKRTALYEKEEFLDVVENAMKGASLQKGKVNGKEFIYVKSDKFVKNYQGRTYLTPDDYRKKGFIESSDLREYVSVGYQTYITDPQLLYDKDRMLYDYFEKVGLVNEEK